MESDTILDDGGQLRHRELLGRLFWLDRLDIEAQSANSPLLWALLSIVMKSAIGLFLIVSG